MCVYACACTHVCVCVIYHDLQLRCYLLNDIQWTWYVIRIFDLGLLRTHLFTMSIEGEISAIMDKIKNITIVKIQVQKCDFSGSILKAASY